MLENGLLFGSQMHWATGIVIIIELFFIIHQFFQCLERPEDKKRRWYFWLLLLLLIYNITGGLFPDEKIKIPIVLQYLLCYGGGLAVSAYCPFYFYKSFAVSSLKFHIKWGIWLFLIGPFFFLFTSCYALTSNIDLAVNYGMAIPLPYSFILLIAIGKAIYKKYEHELICDAKEVVLMFISVFPWGLMAIMSLVGITQLQELILANVGFLFFRVFYVKEEFRGVRKKESNIQVMNHVIAEKDAEIVHLRNLLDAKTEGESGTESNDNHFEEIANDRQNNELSNEIFNKNCKKYLTKAQTEVVKMVNEGLTYQKIAKMRGVSDSYIRELMSIIGKRLKVKGKANILLKLSS